MHERNIGNPRFCIQMDTKTRIYLNLYANKVGIDPVPKTVSPIIMKHSFHNNQITQTTPPSEWDFHNQARVLR